MTDIKIPYKHTARRPVGHHAANRVSGSINSGYTLCPLQQASIAIYPLRYALVEGKRTDPNPAPDCVMPPYKTEVKPTGIRLARPGFIYVCHSDFPDYLLEYSLTAVEGHPPECKREGMWEVTYNSQGKVSDFVRVAEARFAEKDANELLMMQTLAPVAKETIVVPRRGSICIAYLPDLGEAMTASKVEQWLITPWAERCNLMQEVSLTGFDCINGIKDLMPVALADKAVAECWQNTPVAVTTQTSYLDTLTTPDPKQPWFWSTAPYHQLRASYEMLSHHLQAQIAGSHVNDCALLLMHDDAGIIKDLVNYQNLAQTAKDNWGEKKEDSINKNYTNAYRYEAGGMIQAMIAMVPADINQALQQAGFMAVSDAHTRQQIGQWAVAYYQLFRPGGTIDSETNTEKQADGKLFRKKVVELLSAGKNSTEAWGQARIYMDNYHSKATLQPLEQPLQKALGTRWAAMKKTLVTNIDLDQNYDQMAFEASIPKAQLMRKQKKQLLAWARLTRRINDKEQLIMKDSSGSLALNQAESLSHLQSTQHQLETELSQVLGLYWLLVKGQLTADITQKQLNRDGRLFDPAPTIGNEICLSELTAFMQAADARMQGLEQLTTLLVNDRITALKAFDFKPMLLYDKNKVSQYKAGLDSGVAVLTGLSATEAGTDFMLANYFQNRSYFSRLRWPYESYQALPRDDEKLRETLALWQTSFTGNLKKLKDVMRLGSDLKQTLTNLTEYTKTVENSEAMLSACLDPAQAKFITIAYEDAQDLSLENRFNRLVKAYDWAGFNDELIREQLKNNMQIVLVESNDAEAFSQHIKQATTQLNTYAKARHRLNRFWQQKNTAGHFDVGQLNEADRHTWQQLSRTLADAREQVMQSTTELMQSTEPLTGTAGLKVMDVEGEDLFAVTEQMKSLQAGVRRGFGGYATGYTQRDEIIDQLKSQKSLIPAMAHAGNLLPLLNAWNAAVGLSELKKDDPEWFEVPVVLGHIANLVASVGTIFYEARRSRLEQAFYAFQQATGKEAGQFATALGRFTVTGSIWLSGFNLVAMAGTDLTDSRHAWQAFQQGNPRAAFGALLQTTGDTGQAAIFTRQLIAGSLRWKAGISTAATKGAWITGGAELGEILAVTNLWLLGFTALTFAGQWIYDHFNPDQFMTWLNQSAWGQHEVAGWDETAAKNQLACALQAPRLQVQGISWLIHLLISTGSNSSQSTYGQPTDQLLGPARQCSGGRGGTYLNAASVSSGFTDARYGTHD